MISTSAINLISKNNFLKSLTANHKLITGIEQVRGIMYISPILKKIQHDCHSNMTTLQSCIAHTESSQICSNLQYSDKKISD